MIKTLETTINDAGMLAMCRMIDLVQTVSLPPWLVQLTKLVILNILAAALAGEMGVAPIAAEILKGL